MAFYSSTTNSSTACASTVWSCFAASSVASTPAASGLLGCRWRSSKYCHHLTIATTIAASIFSSFASKLHLILKELAKLTNSSKDFRVRALSEDCSFVV